eukprot:c12894_g4_i1.p1 GENE.c12894_g4_i1~~c12894_g4_i1.p1  ORF type:complete len:249 (-),score=63.67 c12894_g4_i1:70-747(-)
MARVQLSSGAINQIWSGLKDFKPILQVVDIRKIGRSQAANSPASERFRLVLSDGTHYQQGMLATQKNNVMDDGLTQFCIVQLDQFQCSNVQARRVIIVLNMSLVETNVPGKIGNPTNIEATAAQGSPPPEPPAYQQAHPSGPTNNTPHNQGNNFDQCDEYSHPSPPQSYSNPPPTHASPPQYQQQQPPQQSRPIQQQHQFQPPPVKQEPRQPYQQQQQQHITRAR